MLNEAGEDGLSRSDIRDALGGDVSGERIAGALNLLRVEGHARVEYRPTGGRPEERWQRANTLEETLGKVARVAAGTFLPFPTGLSQARKKRTRMVV
jgi:hypothetical protein